jgi:hypothetical protein
LTNSRKAAYFLRKTDRPAAILMIGEINMLPHMTTDTYLKESPQMLFDAGLVRGCAYHLYDLHWRSYLDPYDIPLLFVELYDLSKYLINGESVEKAIDYALRDRFVNAYENPNNWCYIGFFDSVRNNKSCRPAEDDFSRWISEGFTVEYLCDGGIQEHIFDETPEPSYRRFKRNFTEPSRRLREFKKAVIGFFDAVDKMIGDHDRVSFQNAPRYRIGKSPVMRDCTSFPDYIMINSIDAIVRGDMCLMITIGGYIP